MANITATDPHGKTWAWAELPDDEFPQYASEHWAVDESGYHKMLPFCRFKHYRAEHFVAYVEAGFPSKPGNWLPYELTEINCMTRIAA